MVQNLIVSIKHLKGINGMKIVIENEPFKNEKK